MRDEYDLTNAVRGHHAERYARGVTITVREDEETQGEGDKTEMMREKYDLSKAIETPYAQQVGELNLVSLDADVRAVFPDANAVNTALRMLIKTAEKIQIPVQDQAALKKAS